MLRVEKELVRDKIPINEKRQSVAQLTSSVDDVRVRLTKNAIEVDNFQSI